MPLAVVVTYRVRGADNRLEGGGRSVGTVTRKRRLRVHICISS